MFLFQLAGHFSFWVNSACCSDSCSRNIILLKRNVHVSRHLNIWHLILALPSSGLAPDHAIPGGMRGGKKEKKTTSLSILSGKIWRRQKKKETLSLPKLETWLKRQQQFQPFWNDWQQRRGVLVIAGGQGWWLNILVFGLVNSSVPRGYDCKIPGLLGWL